MHELTKPQRWALEQIAAGKGSSPATLGEAMMERPGASTRGDNSYRAQGYGRMGGAMMYRLSRKGLVYLTHYTKGCWHPTRATITAEGRLAIKGGSSDA